MKVIAALDNSLAARPVVATAGALAELLDSNVEALHVGENGNAVARSAAASAGLEGCTCAPGRRSSASSTKGRRRMSPRW